MNSNTIVLTFNWNFWCRRVGRDFICTTGNILSNQEVSSRNVNTPEPRDVVRTIISRLAGLNKSKPVISAVFGEPDFLPFRFLEKGLRSGAAVCRLGRKFSLESAENFVDIINNASKNNPDFEITTSVLSEILSLDESQKRFLFKDSENKLLSELSSKEIAEKITELSFVPAATAFLVGRNHLLTNYHAFPKKNSFNFERVSELDLDIDSIKEYVVQFNYEQDILGREIVPVEYCIEDIIAGDENLDYVLLTLSSKPEKSNNYSGDMGVAGDHFGWIQMLEDPVLIAPSYEKQGISNEDIEKELINIKREDPSLLEKFLKSSNTFRFQNPSLKNTSIDLEIIKDILKKRSKYGEPVNIIQHPKGRRKEIIVSNNWTIKLFNDYLWYEADADFSSSGSPVFNQQWQLVALHHGAIPPSEQEEAKQEGIRICRIVQSLRDKLDQLVNREDLRNNNKEKLRAKKLWRFFVEFVEYDDVKGKPTLPPGYEEEYGEEEYAPKQPPTQTY
jgi:hypothetical protein